MTHRVQNPLGLPDVKLRYVGRQPMTKRPRRRWVDGNHNPRVGLGLRGAALETATRIPST